VDTEQLIIKETSASKGKSSYGKLSEGKPKLLDQVRTVMRVKHYSKRTEEAYIGWIKRFVYFHNLKHPMEMGEKEIVQFLNYLAVKGNVSASTQNQALSSLLFLYKEVLKKEIGELKGIKWAKKSKRLPVVLLRPEIKSVLSNLNGRVWIIANLLYGGGLRLLECLRLRVKDIEFPYNQIIVRDGKGNKDRVTILPDAVKETLKAYLKDVKKLHLEDLRIGRGCVYLPDALAKKYPNACKEWGWQYVFPADKLSKDPISGKTGRHHLSESVVQKAVREAVKRSGISKPASCHTFRHSFATHLLENGTHIRKVQDLLGHRSLNTTMIYTHLTEKVLLGVKSPADTL
jgi:integron integrase